MSWGHKMKKSAGQRPFLPMFLLPTPSEYRILSVTHAPRLSPARVTRNMGAFFCCADMPRRVGVPE